MRMNLYFLFSTALFFILNCSNQQKEIDKVIIINTSNLKKCEFLIISKNDTLKFKREVYIIENTINDTIIIGNGIIVPNQLGKFYYTKFKDRDDINLNLEYSNPPADRICISSFREKISKGKIKLRLKVIKN